jgi:carbon monoxide dehydrogenase subunit G
VELTHAFTVPVDVPTAWAAFEDVASVAECFPGAAVTSVDGDRFEGTCKVKLGPISLQYAGSGVFVERDETTRRLVMEAKGRDKRGNGTAGAHVTAGFVDAGGGSTRVEVVTELQITGKPAQFGRGVMQDVSDKLLAQFVTCLESRVAGAGLASDSSSAPAEASPEPATTDSGSDLSAPDPVVPQAGEDALDLGRTVLPVLVRTYGPWVAIVLALALLIRWRSRRR